VNVRHTLGWKQLFYDGLLPVLRRLGPGACDRALTTLGRIAALPRRQRLTESLRRIRAAVGAEWHPPAVRSNLAANHARFAARDYLLEHTSDADFASRFDVVGFEHLQVALGSGRGAILVGSHLGAYLAAVHWLVRHELPIRFLVQRPRHVSPSLHHGFDRAGGRHPQSAYFLRRDLPPAEAAQRLVRAHAALRDGMAVYLSGDVPWPSRRARSARFLGVERPFLATWAELASLTASPVIPLFCTHLPASRYRLEFFPPQYVSPAQESAAVAGYLAVLEAAIAAHPHEAIAYLTWPCFARL
jgi:lauroyl/myristoyl acyltransferase